MMVFLLHKMLTLGHLQTSLHGSLLIAFLHKMLTLGHLQTSLHGSLLIAFFIFVLLLVFLLGIEVISETDVDIVVAEVLP